MMDNEKISIILINYNSLDFTIQCIKSIVETTISEYEIIVVDNNSNDKNEIKKLEKEFNQVKVFLIEKNLGFGGGNNFGVSRSTGKYLLILNNDTIVCPQTIDNLKSLLKYLNKNIVITGLIEGIDGKIQISGGKKINVFNELLEFGFFLIKKGPQFYYNKYYFYPMANNKITTIDWVTGCFFAIHREFYLELGGFDENMFMYVEDVEFGRRIWKSGGQIQFHPNIKIKHFGQQSTKSEFTKVLISEYQNTYYYLKKHNLCIEYYIFHFVSKMIFLLWVLIFSPFTLIKKSKFYSKFKMFKILFLTNLVNK
jgi:GT2 family glycosyltransferase